MAMTGVRPYEPVQQWFLESLADEREWNGAFQAMARELIDSRRELAALKKSVDELEAKIPLAQCKIMV